MSTSQYLLNLVLLAFILGANLGTRTFTYRRLVLPLVLVGIAASAYLRDVPTVGNDVALEVVGAVAGVLLGVVAGLLVHVERDVTGRLTMRAGAAYASLWVAVIGGRILFAYGAGNWFSRSIGEFSITHQITGADAWTAAFVVMALAMVVTRVAVTALSTLRAAREIPAVVA